MGCGVDVGKTKEVRGEMEFEKKRGIWNGVRREKGRGREKGEKGKGGWSFFLSIKKIKKTSVLPFGECVSELVDELVDEGESEDGSE